MRTFKLEATAVGAFEIVDPEAVRFLRSRLAHPKGGTIVGNHYVANLWGIEEQIVFVIGTNL